jgi:DNA-binding beta-propeller fold protein YncE
MTVMRAFEFVAAVLALGLLRLGAEPPEGPHRSPIDLALLPRGRLLTANHTADTVSLVDAIGGKVLAEATCGHKPAAVACTADGKRAAVSNVWSDTISLFDVGDAALKSAGEVPVGTYPRSLVFAGDGRTLYVALSGADEVAEIDVAARKVTHRWPAPREPRRVLLSADGKWLAATSTRSACVRVWDTATRKLLWERAIEDAFNLRGLVFAHDGQSLLCSHVVRRDFPVSKSNIEEGWVIDSRLTRLPLEVGARPSLEQIALDTRGRAVGDPEGLAFDPEGKYLALAASGTQELLLFEAAALPWSRGDPGDFLDRSLTRNDRLRRFDLGGRPLALAFLPGGKQLAVANYLLDAVQVVEVPSGKVLRTVPLGGPSKPGLARQGEALFHDARRSHNHWFSCHTCHTDGHTCGLNFDTLNDDSYGNPKLTPSLRGVTRTGPWTWHGWQTDLGAGVEKSYTETMFGAKPSQGEVRAVLAFLATLDHPPNPHRRDGKLGAEARRGQVLFDGKARCARCHKGDDYTSDRNYDVKLEPDGSPYTLWNPPSLRGLHDRGPCLHDGRAHSLDDLLRTHHAPEKLGGEALTDDERRDLIAFLNAL